MCLVSVNSRYKMAQIAFGISQNSIFIMNILARVFCVARGKLFLYIPPNPTQILYIIKQKKQWIVNDTVY